jgi:PKD repeat protein
MKTNTTFLLFSYILFSMTVFSQTAIQQIDRSNCREGEDVEYCVTHKKMKELLSDPAKKQEYDAYRLSMKEQVQKMENSKSVEKGVIYKIPVVFHVLHNNGNENISRAQILDALSILNRDFKRLNADADNVAAPFQGMPVDIEVEFVLATKAPNGACFSGITRTQSVLTTDLGEDSNGNNLDNVDGGDQVNAIVAGNDVFNGTWPGDKYLNIFVCKEISGAAGYTYQPSWSGMSNGIWVKSTYVGSIGTSSVSTSRTLTHECGHWFNLDHTWGGNNNPGNPSSCATDDDVEDTPLCIGVTSCAMSSNTCNDLTPSNGTFSSWTTNVIDNVENYMDYSYCSKMFTPGQKTRMRAALASDVGGRMFLWATDNLNATGANGAVNLCKTDFFPSKTTICVGETVSFTDATYNAATGWIWTFTGASTPISYVQNPSVVYNTPGFYTVSLSATDGTSTDVETKTALIQVLPAPSSLPFYEGFESYSTLNGTDWSIYDAAGNRRFSLYNGTGSTGSKCVKLSNFNETVATVDELMSASVDLSAVIAPETVTLSFRYAYRKKVTTNSESLKIMASTDCGTTWTTRKTLSGIGLSSLTATSAWTPTTTSDWTTVHVTTITTSYFTSNFRYKFQFNGSGGNNIYLDDINLYKGAPSDVLVTEFAGIAEETSNLTEVEVYPNPTEGELNVHFSVPANEAVEIQIQDITGKIAQNNFIKAKTGSNLVLLDTSKLSSGVYFIKMQFANTQKTIQFVVK